MGPTHPNYSRAAPSDGDEGLPQAMGTGAGPGDGEEGCPRHSAPTAPSQHPSRASLRLVGAPWPWTPTLVGRGKPPSTTACLACTLGPATDGAARTPLPGRWAWGQEIPWDKGAWVSESRARWSQLSTAEVGAMRWLGEPQNPLPHSCPIPPHTSLLAEVRAGTQLSVGLGPSHRGWAQVPGGGFHLDSRFTGMGTERNVPGKSATPVPNSQDVPGDVGDPG